MENEQNEAHISNGASCRVSLSSGELDLLATVESLAWKLEFKIWQLSKRNGNLNCQDWFPPPQLRVCVLKVYSCVAKMLNNVVQTSSGGFFISVSMRTNYFFSYLKLRICFQGFNIKRSYSETQDKTETFSNFKISSGSTYVLYDFIFSNWWKAFFKAVYSQKNLEQVENYFYLTYTSGFQIHCIAISVEEVTSEWYLVNGDQNLALFIWKILWGGFQQA